jgi:hypothetical protein
MVINERIAPRVETFTPVTHICFKCYYCSLFNYLINADIPLYRHKLIHVKNNSLTDSLHIYIYVCKHTHTHSVPFNVILTVVNFCLQQYGC